MPVCLPNDTTQFGDFRLAAPNEWAPAALESGAGIKGRRDDVPQLSFRTKSSIIDHHEHITSHQDA